MRVVLLLLGLLLPLSVNAQVVIIGKVRPAISPYEVKLYNTPPPNYEEIALVEATSQRSFTFSAQRKMDIVIGRLKEHAAALGANGILLQGVGDRQVGSINSGSGSVYGPNAYGTGVSIPIKGKAGKGIAIYVPPDAPNP